MAKIHKIRRTITACLVVVGLIAAIAVYPEFQQQIAPPAELQEEAKGEAKDALEQIAVKGRASKTGYERAQFGDGWEEKNGCDTRNTILNRDLTEVVLNEKCQVVSGILADPYAAKTITFTRGETTSDDVQVDHVVALSDAWQKGAQQLTLEKRIEFANDPLELLAVDGPANQQKGDGDAASWLPPNKAFRCQYIARQIAVKKKYSLWVTEAEKSAMLQVLASCPGQKLP